ncbi:MAG TPA: hypothetical protein VF074_21055, partial [Pyrinomonadaceae bacterium]
MKNQMSFGLRCLALSLVIIVVGHEAYGQRGLTLWGEVNVKDSADDIKKPLSLTIVLYNLGGSVIGRQTVPSG